MRDARYTKHLAVFIDVARSGSFSAVGRKRGLTPSSITRQIDMLEAVIGASLFVRSTRGLKLTETGDALFARAVGILDALTDMHAEISSLSNSLQGVLRVSCLPTFGKLHILPWLPELHQRYPGLRVDLDLTERITNPSIERLDAAIRIGQLKDSALFATRIATQRWLVCASPAYLAAHGMPASIDGLAGHRIIDKLHDPHAICWKRLLDRAPLQTVTPAFRCDDFDALRQAAVRGLGLAFLPDWVVAADLQAQRLQLVFGDPDPRRDGIHLLRALPKMSAKLEAFLQALQAHIGQCAGWQQADSAAALSPPAR